MPRVEGASREQKFAWCFTAHAMAAIDALAAIRAHEAIPVEYALIGNELTADGQPHAQGYVEFARGVRGKPNGWRMTELKAINPQWHWEPRRGTQDQAIKYITGPGPITCHDGHVKVDFDPDPVIYGTPQRERGNQGQRTDIEAVKSAILAGALFPEICAEFSAQVLRSPTGVKMLYDNLAPKLKSLPHPGPEVHLVIGGAGSRKSSFIEETLLAGKDYFKIDPPNSVGGATWCDRYRGEKHVWLFDFKGTMTRSQFISLLDRYPVSLQCKHGSFEARPTHFYICSNRAPGLWYKSDTPADKEEICRRITSVYIPDGNFGFQKIDNGAQWCRDNFDKVY